MEWNFDISQAPRGHTVKKWQRSGKRTIEIEVFQYDPVILATKCGVVTKSRLLPAGPEREEDRWEGLAKGSQPIAWMHWPTHPYEEKEN